MPQQDLEQRRRTMRATHLLLITVVAVAVIGFFVGIDSGVPRPGAPPIEPARRPVDRVQVPAAPEVVPAMSYADMRRENVGPNRGWRSDLDRLPRAEVDLMAEVTPTLEEKLAALEARARRRAYNGAPPVIPHSVDQLSSAQCLFCHEAALRVGDKVSPRPPHPYLANCQQCHVQAAPAPFEPFVLARNEFVGLPAPLEGERAWTGAPPVIPHSTHMRSDCLACHGPTGAPGLKTTHAWRRNCLQCHAPSAVLEQGIVADVQFLPAPPVEEQP